MLHLLLVSSGSSSSFVCGHSIVVLVHKICSSAPSLITVKTQITGISCRWRGKRLKVKVKDEILELWSAYWLTWWSGYPMFGLGPRPFVACRSPFLSSFHTTYVQLIRGKSPKNILKQKETLELKKTEKNPTIYFWQNFKWDVELRV